MQSFKAIHFGSLALLTSACCAHAATISWTTAPITGDSNVGTNGALVEAANFGGSGVPDVTVNTVIFTGVDFLGGGSLTNLVGLTYNNSQNAHATATGGSVDTLLDTIAFESGTNPQTASLTGLVPGKTYEVQFFMNHPPTSGRVQTINDGLGNTVALTNVPASFATGTFTADGATQALTFTSSQGSQLMNGYQLRDLSAAGAIPEPSTALLALLGFSAICLRRSKF